MKTRYSKQTKRVIDNALQYLKTRYGEVKPEWQNMLYMYADNLELYDQMFDSIQKEGIYDPSTGRKHPLLSSLKDLQATLFKQVQHLGLSPYSASKIKQAEEDDSNLLSAIMCEDE